MKYLARTLFVIAIASFAFGLVSCWRNPDPNRTAPPGYEADGDHRPYVAFSRFFAGLAGGGVALALGAFFRSKAREQFSFSGQIELLSVLRPRFCPKCGKPLSRRDCERAKQFGLLPRLLCSNCKVYGGYSGAIVFGVGVLLLLRAFLIPAPEALLALSVLSVPVGICFLFVGILRIERQQKMAKKYASTRNPAATA